MHCLDPGANYIKNLVGVKALQKTSAELVKFKNLLARLDSMLEFTMDTDGSELSYQKVANFLNDLGAQMEEIWALNSLIKAYL